MTRRHRNTLFALSLAAPLLLANSAYAKIVCWENSDGVRECGNAVPPEYAQKETRTINEQGRTTEIQERAKTPAEIAAENARIAKEEQAAADEAKRKSEQDAYDRVLLSTYLVENDIIRSRERQSGSIDATIEITTIAMEKLEERLGQERKRAADLERQGKKLPERLQQDIASLQEQINAKQAFIQSKQLEKERLHARYEADIARFRELKANGVKLQ